MARPSDIYLKKMWHNVTSADLFVHMGKNIRPLFISRLKIEVQIIAESRAIEKDGTSVVHAAFQGPFDMFVRLTYDQHSETIPFC